MPSRPFAAALRDPVMHLKEGIIIDLHGEINGTVETALNVAFDHAEKENPLTIVLNFSDVDYINSTGIALIVGLLARAMKAKRTLMVFGLSSHYMDIFNITRLADFMSIYPDEQAAVEHLKIHTSEE